MSETPILCTWQGDSFTPASARWQKEADKLFTIGERYLISTAEERSATSHRHYFAAINEAWMNLPESLAEEYPNAEKLRKHALIKAGYADSQTFACSSRAEALRLQTWLRPIDEFSIIRCAGATVTRYTAQSQSMKAMGKERFQQSKEAVLEVIAGMIGTTAATLDAQAQAA